MSLVLLPICQFEILSLNEGIVFFKKNTISVIITLYICRYVYTALLYPVTSLIELKCSSCFGLAHLHVACLQPEHALPLKGFFTSTILVFIVTQYLMSHNILCSLFQSGITAQG